ncbi:UDP-glucose dehydrogenase family protein [Paenibacillus prosopidis]|nr:nucleotide sugar dehydrogenase [Paenibacillus prosopidis]
MQQHKSIAVIGLGFVGLTTALGFAEKGHRVFGYDQDALKRASYQSGCVPFYEPGVEEALRRQLDKRFLLCNSIALAVQQAELIFLCVGTPVDEVGEMDLSSLIGALTEVLRCVSKDRFYGIAVKSTIPPGTMREHLIPLLLTEGFELGTQVGLAYNPEFLREGSAWNDFLFPDRIVTGSADDRTGRLLEEAYSLFQAPYHRVSPTSAEFVKLASNTLLATMISFANEQAMLAEKIGDIHIPTIFNLLHTDRRWSGQPAEMSKYIYPGCGFGGYCLPKDTFAFQRTAEKYGHRPKLLNAVLDINRDVMESCIERIVAKLGNLDQQVGILGLSFKPGSDDVRGTPSARMIELLLERGCRKIAAYDPMAMSAFSKHYTFPVTMMASVEELERSSDVVVIATAWEEFRTKQHVFDLNCVIDARYLLEDRGDNCNAQPILTNKSTPDVRLI